jgi:hypothetical protein
VSCYARSIDRAYRNTQDMLGWGRDLLIVPAESRQHCNGLIGFFRPRTATGRRRKIASGHNEQDIIAAGNSVQAVCSQRVCET